MGHLKCTWTDIFLPALRGFLNEANEKMNLIDVIFVSITNLLYIYLNWLKSKNTLLKYVDTL